MTLGVVAVVTCEDYKSCLSAKKIKRPKLWFCSMLFFYLNNSSFSYESLKVLAFSNQNILQDDWNVDYFGNPVAFHAAREENRSWSSTFELYSLSVS